MRGQLSIFLKAQQNDYRKALSEIKSGKKQSHWMWYIFPQISGLGFSHYSQLYAIRNVEEAAEFLTHPVLGKRLIEISNALVELQGKTAHDIFGNPDDMKLRSCMTLFSSLENTDPVFQQVLDKYFNGKPDPVTLELITKENSIDH